MKSKKIMLPAWLKYKHYTLNSMGWRMGDGESYIYDELNPWIASLSDDDKEEYEKLFPQPVSWSKQTKGYNIEWVIENNVTDFQFFWGHKCSKDGVVNHSCLSQWYMCDFKVNAETFCCMEQYMMFRKAWLFQDEDMAKEIKKCNDPSKIKSLGRKISNFDEKKWSEHKYEIVIEGNYYKFIQNKKLLNFLFSTKDMVLVEASPFDTIWGIGMSTENDESKDPEKWNGENLLGFALMEVRNSIKEVIKNEQLATE